MPADYQSTAQALALPISPPRSPSLERSSLRPAWSDRISSRTRRGSPFSTNRGSYKDQILRSADQVQHKIITTFSRLSLTQKILGTIGLIGAVIFGTLFLIFNERVFTSLIPIAEKWRDIPGGWMILFVVIIIAAFPPMIGYSSCVTIAGFVYGFPNGWYIVASSTVVGSLCSFLACRTILSKYVHRLVGQDKRFEALALTLKHDGIKILCMIRFCPLPYSPSNAAIAAFPTIQPLSFAIATALSTPKLIIPIFIGSRMASIGEGGEGMKASTKLLNYFSILFGAGLGIGVGYVIYQRTIARARELEIEELEGGGTRGRADFDTTVGRGSYTDDAVESDAVALMNDDDISLWDAGEGPGGPDAVYRDDFTDDEDVFASGDAEDEGALSQGLKGSR